MAALVALESSKGPLPADKAEQIYELGQKIAMHAVAMRPQFLDKDSVSFESLEAEKQVLREQAAKTGKPANIVEKMIQGRLSKFYEEVCLLEQKFVMDDSKKIKDVVKEAAKMHGIDLKLTGYVRLQVGEGLQSQAKDFASEVAEAVKSS
jgi:elongation factor Ts